MFRSWPNCNEEDTLLVWFPKTVAFLNVFITGIFFIFSTVCLFFSGRIFVSAGITVMTAFGILVLGGFWLCIGYFFLKYLKIILGKRLLTFIANREGLFLDISTKSKEAFFIPWKEINGVAVRKVNDPFWHNGGFKTKSDTLSISFTEEVGQRMPKYAKNVAAATKREINLHSTSIDQDLEDAVDRLNAMKAKFS